MEEKFKLKWVVYDSKNDTVKFTNFQDFGWVESKAYVLGRNVVLAVTLAATGYLTLNAAPSFYITMETL
jgi:hypothetical protein